jgi:membrane protease subunit HflC
VEIYAAAYKSDPDFYEFVRTLEAYKKVIDEKTTLILSINSELFDLIKGKK